MSPFRSESEQVKEQLRRAEERVQELLDEKADLERQIAIGRRPRSWAIAVGLTVLLAGTAGFVLAAIDGARQRKTLEAELLAKLAIAHKGESSCREMLGDYTACVDELRRARLQLLPSSTPPPGCDCVPGDPLCSCLDGPRRRGPIDYGPGAAPFDRGAAAAALGSVELGDCGRLEGPTGSGHVTVTFGAEGGVNSAVIDGAPFAGTPRGGCVAAKFRSARGLPFTGAPVRVGKSFSLP